MVLRRLVNKGNKDITMPWGAWNLTIKAGGYLENQSESVNRAFTDRYPAIELQLIDTSKSKEEKVEVKEEVKEEIKILESGIKPVVEFEKKRKKIQL